jgi:DtxR family transcriptional regulator, manganese transport regulator
MLPRLQSERPRPRERAPKRNFMSRRANRFTKVRADHSTETAEDYVEAVSDIVHRAGECRVKDLADLMGVSHVTVTRIVARLQELALVQTEPYRPIRLTAQGERLAAAARRRHAVVLEFLRSMGVPDPEAERDAEGIEHHVGEATLEAMRRHLEAVGRWKEAWS